MPEPICVGWKQGYHARVKAEVAYRELKAIEKRDGGVTPEAVVKSAARKKSPLHPQFTWDDSKAAHQHRLDQARRMCRSITIRYEEAPRRETRAFEVVSTHEGRPSTEPTAINSYRCAEEALSDPEYRQQVLDRAKADLARIRERYAALEELSDVFATIDKFTRKRKAA